MSILIQTAPGELAHLEAELQLAIVTTATSITGRILGQSIYFCAHDLRACRPHLLQQKINRLSQ
jgi:hypothetical protein